MRKISSLILLLVTVLILGACSERRYGEGDIVEVLINLSDNQEEHFFVNLHLINHSNDEVSVRVVGFEFLEGENWVSIPPVSEEEWVTDSEFTLGPKDLNNRAMSALSFEEWLNPTLPTLGTFRVKVQVYDLEGEYLFTQVSNERKLEYFTFDE